MTMKTKNRSLVQKVFTETCRGAPLELRYYRREEIDQLLRKLARGTVTPESLREVIEDSL